MYESYWGLKERPFENTPDPRFLYRSEEVEDAYTRLRHALHNHRGAALLTGDTGCGKTLMVRALLQELNRDSTEIALLTSPCRTGEESLSEVLYQLGEDGGDRLRQQVAHRIHERVYEAYAHGRETILVVDEAHLLDEPSILEEIRLLLNLQLDDAFLITVLLVGQPPLAERVRRYGPLDQRIATRGYLRPFDPEGTGAYVAHRLGTAGRQEPVFTPEALDLVFNYSGGIPRQINNICDIALVIGYSRRLKAVDGDWMRRLIQAERGDR